MLYQDRCYLVDVVFRLFLFCYIFFMIPLKIANRNMHIAHTFIYGKIKAKQNKFYYNIKNTKLREKKRVQMKPERV